jgi:hypothetical protein
MIHNKQEGGGDGSGVYSVAESDKLEVAFVDLFPSPNRFPLFIVLPVWYNRSPKCLMRQSGTSIRKNEFSKERECRCWLRFIFGFFVFKFIVAPYPHTTALSFLCFESLYTLSHKMYTLGLMLLSQNAQVILLIRTLGCIFAIQYFCT